MWVFLYLKRLGIQRHPERSRLNTLPNIHNENNPVDKPLNLGVSTSPLSLQSRNLVE